MKLIIAGSRHIEQFIAYGECVKWRIANRDKVATEIVSGGNGGVREDGVKIGVDLAGEWYADYYDIHVRRFNPDWNKHGKAAGPIRNRQMAEYADALLLIWDGQSRGSANMKTEMLRLKKPVYEIILR